MPSTKKKASRKKPAAAPRKSQRARVRPAAKPASRKAVTVKRSTSKEQVVGIVTHFFPRVSAAAVKLKAPLKTGADVRIKGHTTDFTQTIASMQLDHAAIAAGRKGQEVGIQVKACVRRHDKVILVKQTP